MKHKIQSLIMITLSTFIMAVGVYFFKFPDNFCFGGITGFATVVAKVTPISASNFTFIANTILLVIGFIFLGKSFALKTTYASMLLSVLLVFFEKWMPLTKPLSNEPMLDLIFAIALPAIASALLFNIGASSGGTDFIAVSLSSRLHKPSWNFVFGINVVILTTAGFLFGFEAAMYSIIFQFVSTQTINTLHRKDQKATMFIVTRHGAMLEQKIMECTRHGITHLAVQGCYLKEDKDMLYTVLGEDEVKEVTALVHSLDPEAFINIIKSEGIAGRFYEEPLE